MRIALTGRETAEANVQVPALHSLREGHAHRWDNHKAAGCRHRDGLEHKKMPFWGQKQMDSARGVHHLHCIAMFVYIPHNEEKPLHFLLAA